MLVRLIIAIISALSCLAAYASTEDKNDMLIDSIEEHIARYSYVRQQKKDLLDSMKSMRAGMPAGEQRIRLGEILGRRYICHNIDSAMLYWRLANREAEDIGDKELSTRLRLNLLAVMPLRGISIEAVREFEKIDPANFSPELKHLYWLNYSELYNNIQKPYPPGMMKNRYREKAALALDSLLAYYPPQSPVAAFIKSYLHLLRDEKNMAAASFLESLPALEQRPELYDHAIANVVDFYRDRPNHKELYLNYLYTRLLRQLRNGDAKPRVLAEAGQNLINQGHDKLGQQLMLLAMHTSEKRTRPLLKLRLLGIHTTVHTTLHHNTKMVCSHPCRHVYRPDTPHHTPAQVQSSSIHTQTHRHTGRKRPQSRSRRHAQSIGQPLVYGLVHKRTA